MAESFPASKNKADRTAWVLRAPGAGDNHQLQSLARLAAGEVRWFDEFDPVIEVLIDRFKLRTSQTIPAKKQARYSPPWPDLILIAGGRSVVDAMRIRSASNGHSRIVCIGRPWAPLDWFDLVITTPQYRLPAAGNVICLSLPMNLPSTSTSDESEPVPEAWQSLPRPWHGVLLGGDSGSYRLNSAAAQAIARVLRDALGAEKGSILVVTSPRTPAAGIETLRSELKPPCSIHPWRANDDSDIYKCLLDQADALWVTCDSASMLADAVYSGKPVSVLPLALRWRTRLMKKLSSLNLPGQSFKNRWVEQGRWLPARDLELLHTRAREHGLIDSGADSQPASDRSDDGIKRLHVEIERVINYINQWFKKYY